MKFLKFLIALIGFSLFCFGYKGLTSGKVKISGFFKISKEEKSTLYWINVIVYFVVGIAGIIFGLVS